MNAEHTIVFDKLEIREVLFTYATMVDRRDWALQEKVFQKDATIDYTSCGSGATSGPVPDMLVWLDGALAHSRNNLHLISNEIITLDGDKATSVCCFNAPMPTDEAVATNMGYYHDKLVRTVDGWRISERFVEMTLQVFNKQFEIV